MIDYLNLMTSCNHTPKLLIDVDDVQYFASDAGGVTYFDGDVVINLTGVSDIPSSMKIPELAEYIDIGFEEIMVPWPDFGLPRVHMPFWEKLHIYIKSKGWKTACIHCEGGHGRTGTALCSILIAIGGYPVEEAVWRIRSTHCEKAVETSAQCGYLQLVDLHYNDRQPSDGTRPMSSMELERQKNLIEQNENDTKKNKRKRSRKRKNR